MRSVRAACSQFSVLNASQAGTAIEAALEAVEGIAARRHDVPCDAMLGGGKLVEEAGP